MISGDNGTSAQLNGIDSSILKHQACLESVAHRQPAVNDILGVQFDQNRKVVANMTSHCRQDIQNGFGPIFNGSTVSIRAFIESRRKNLGFEIYRLDFTTIFTHLHFRIKLPGFRQGHEM
jgi:hypothetical protein